MTALAQAFDRGASRYDLLVSLNPGYHAHLDSAASLLVRRSRSRSRKRGGGAGVRLLDLACGSGASTRALLRALATHPGPSGQPATNSTPARIVGIDLSEGMLAQARAKAWPDTVSFGQGRVGGLDVDELGRGRWDGVFASYLFRNIPAAERDDALAEVFALLAPDGWLVTQEYSVAGDRRAGAIWDAVAWAVIIPLGALLDRNPGLYRYLWRSVREFDSTAAFRDRLRRAGFAGVACRTVPGWQRGILHTFAARKPETGAAS